ncbi:MAG: saccharopine dehydrogenase NADP-binding domain-containing protein [Thermoplasmata archaeon]|nr:MAG: saccharopine dehydrogenase NADP-binding domain-containing protein [Thermoplasmata archaeon]
MGRRYAVLGSGRQGAACAYDLSRFGDAEQILLADVNLNTAEEAAMHVNKLAGKDICSPLRADVRNEEQLASQLKGISAIISAVPYPLNLGITRTALKIGAHMCDLGGNTDIVRSQLELDSEATKKGISIVPDCGMGPGMNISLALHAMFFMDDPNEVLIWDGGLPQQPSPPWNYELTFSMGGLTNEYSGSAYFIKDGKVVKVPCFEGYEELELPPLGRLEAFVTSGGLSTMPWTFLGRLSRLENRTLRYPGHWAQFRAYAQLGLFGEEPILVGDTEVIPRAVFHALLEPKITSTQTKDVCIIRVRCIGEKDGERCEAEVQLIDYYDEKTGFTAMQRLTGWHASIIAILAAEGRIPRGAVPVENVPGELVVEEARRRGFAITETVRAVG